jgi:ankyrin repeat protein
MICASRAIGRHRAMADRAGRSRLHHAALENDVTAVQRYLAAGDDPDATDAQGFRPLHFAAQQQSVEAARALLEADASVDAKNQHGNTPLWVAVFNSRGDGRLITLLREHGANPYAANAHGNTPVSLARRIANYPVAAFFADLA